MRSSFFIVFVLIATNPIALRCIDNHLVSEPLHTTKTNQPRDMFDDLEREMYETGVDQDVNLPPPTKLEIFLRRIGTPLLLWYAYARKRVVSFIMHYQTTWFPDDSNTES